MGKLRCDISVSVDGYVAGSRQALDQPLGEGGERLHEWAVRLASWRRTHGLPGGETTVDSEVEVGTTFTFVTDGIESALEQAYRAAGEHDVAVSGGATVMQQYLRAGLLEELQIHVAPVLLGDGARLFENHLSQAPVGLECTRTIESLTGVRHLRYRVMR